MNKCISIILPSYNGERFIAEAIESIIAQTYQNWELIIVNDCSTDNTSQIIEEYAQKDNRIHIIHNKQNCKLPKSLNIGFAQAKGEYLTWTSDDNYYKKNALETLINFLEQNQDIDLVSMDMDMISEQGDFISIHSQNFCYERNAPSLLLQCNIGAAFMYRKSIANQVGEYNTELFCAEDYDYWCKIALAGTIAYTNDNIYVYRNNSQSLTATKKEQVIQKTEYVKNYYAKEFFKKFKYTEKDKALFYFYILNKKIFIPKAYYYKLYLKKYFFKFILLPFIFSNSYIKKKKELIFKEFSFLTINQNNTL